MKPTPELDKQLDLQDFTHDQVKSILAGRQADLKALAHDLQEAVPSKEKQWPDLHPSRWNQAIDTTTTAFAEVLRKWGLK